MGNRLRGRLCGAGALFLAAAAGMVEGCSLDEQGACSSSCGDGGTDATRDVDASHDGNRDAPRDTKGNPPPDAAGDAVGGDSAGSDSGGRDDKAPCKKSRDCDAGEACDPLTGACSTTCSSGQPCNGGCCDVNVCVTGDAPTACGSKGACVDCSSDGKGSLCLGSGVCGCNDPATDCPPDHACSSHVCTTACTGPGQCSGGCCDGTQCQRGTGPGACGTSGLACSTCSGSTPTCESDGGCAPCATSADCPTQMACDPIKGTCGASCFGTYGFVLQCNGGCCDFGSGTCSPGTADIQCGSTGGYCANCTYDCQHPKCIGVAAGGSCGCTTNAQCNVGYCGSANTCDLDAGSPGFCL